MFRASSCQSPGATRTAVAASGLPSELGDSGAFGHGRAGCEPAWLHQQHCYHQALTVNQRLLLQLLWLLMMGMRMSETCWAVFKWQVVNLKICCFWLVDSVESMMMHGLTNPLKRERERETNNPLTCKPTSICFSFLSGYHTTGANCRSVWQASVAKHREWSCSAVHWTRSCNFWHLLCYPERKYVWHGCGSDYRTNIELAA